MITFFYNTPSNTLPIFWSFEDNWVPIFQRYDSYNRPNEVRATGARRFSVPHMRLCGVR